MKPTIALVGRLTLESPRFSIDDQDRDAIVMNFAGG